MKYDLRHIFMHHLSLYFDSKVYNLWDHCADTGSWIRGKIRTYEGITDIWGQIRIFALRRANNQHWLLAIIEHAKRTYCNKICDKIRYHIFCCNMFVFACPIIARSQWLLFALGANIRICPQKPVLCPEIQLPVNCQNR